MIHLNESKIIRCNNKTGSRILRRRIQGKIKENEQNLRNKIDINIEIRCTSKKVGNELGKADEVDKL